MLDVKVKRMAGMALVKTLKICSTELFASTFKLFLARIKASYWPPASVNMFMATRGHGFFALYGYSENLKNLLRKCKADF